MCVCDERDHGEHGLLVRVFAAREYQRVNIYNNLIHIRASSAGYSYVCVRECALCGLMCKYQSTYLHIYIFLYKLDMVYVFDWY